MTAQEVIQSVAKSHRITLAEMLGGCRAKQLCDARREACQKLRERGHSYEWIGMRLNRHQTTVIRYCRQKSSQNTGERP